MQRVGVKGGREKNGLGSLNKVTIFTSISGRDFGKKMEIPTSACSFEKCGTGRASSFFFS